MPPRCCIPLLLLAGASALPEILSVDWRRLEDNPGQGGAYGGFQDSDGGFLDEEVVLTAFGYAGGGHFLNTAWLKNTSDPSGNWTALPAAPVSGRQEVGAAIIDGSAYFVGGFSYTAPFTYRDVLKLSSNTTDPAGWSWSSLPPLPYPLCSMGVASVGSKLYVSGGADYDAKAFYTFTDRNGENVGLGRRLLVLDTANTSAGWRRLPDMPGSPRYIHSFSPVTAPHPGTATLLVIGGATANGSTVVDNWSFDTVAETWDGNLPGLPISSGSFQTNGKYNFRNRYVILVGGYQFAHVYHPNGTVVAPYGQPQRMCPPGVEEAGCRQGCPASSSIVNKTYMGVDWSHQYENDVFVYDSWERYFGTVRATSTSDPSLMPTGCGGLPINDNLPQTNVFGSKIFVIGGECNDRVIGKESYTHYPQLALVGAISVI